CHISIRCFFFTSLHPPISTLFPYTTLFRSRLEVAVVYVRGNDHAPARDFAANQFRLQFFAPGDVFHFLADDALTRKMHLGHVPADRKSTRLNSSHGSISYAVFCLKKKQKNY